MDLVAIQYFLDAVRCGSFAAAARDRGVDASTVSRAVSALETKLGSRLLQRTTRRLTLTETGAIYAERIAPLLHDLQTAGDETGDLAQRATGSLRVSAPVSFALLNIVPLLSGFAERYPAVDLDLQLTDAMVDPVAGGLDIAIRLGPLSDSSLIARRLAAMRFVVCASAAYLDRHGRPTSPEELAAHQCLLLDMPGFGDRWRFTEASGQTLDVRVRGRVRSSNAIALKECALRGMGIIAQARWIVGQELRSGRLVDLYPEYTVDTASFAEPAIWMLYPSRSYLPLKVRAFIEYMNDAFAHGPPWDGALAQSGDNR